MGSLFKQSFRLPTPTLTEANCPDQQGKSFLITGGYAGIGFELSKILYSHNANVFVAGRSASKAEKAMTALKAASPNAKGRLEFVQIDLADLKTIKPGLQPFLDAEKDLHGLMLNAGVMNTPGSSKDAQGNELQLGTNCLGHWLVYTLLKPLLVDTASRSPPASVRVGWAASSAVDLFSPRPGGVKFDKTGKPAISGQPMVNYGQSKTGSVFFASIEAERAQREKNGVVHVAFNPGNLKTELQRHSSLMAPFIGWMLYPAPFGAYTELYALLSPDVTVEKNGAYIWPWGRFGDLRADVAASCKSESEGGTGVAARFVDWCEQETKAHL